ncbi:RNA-guided endonuclease InsQ/TnpB family protein [Sphaerisporangium viridialbum]|uniref:RNA-guided endonuclease InsQ/TnpB family protein n=1 Tax=Sphaerisporangium viridialbum TaxID=46189 RepID=UPI003C713235
MKLRYNYRLYPDAPQREMLAKTFGCARVVWNDAVAARKAARRAGLGFIGDAEIQRLVLTAAKKTPERAWLGEVSSVVLQQSVRDVNTAYKNFFDSVSGKRKGPKMGLPVFKSRHDHRQAARFTTSAFSLTGRGRLYLAKIGQVEVRWSRGLPAAPSSVTVVKDAAGRYFASFVVEVDDATQVLPEVDAETGIDLGLAHYAVLSNGEKIANPKWLRRREKKLARLQRGLSRKEKGSNNRDRVRVRVARQHAKVADARRDFLHQTSTSIIRENQVVHVETLSVRGLARGRLAKSVNDVSWGAFVTLVEGKAARYGRALVKIDRWFPSSQLCPCCGWRVGKLPLDVRAWDCRSCGEHHDRDIAAAINILLEGQRNTGTTVAAGLAGHGINDCGGQVRPGEATPTLAPPETYDDQAA